MNYFNNTQQQIPPVGNLLSKEEIDTLIRNQHKKEVLFTDDDFMKGRCCHRYTNGEFALDEVDGGFRCHICGEKFKTLTKEDREDLEKAIEIVRNAIQTIKTYNISIGGETMHAITNASVILGCIPDSLIHAIDVFKKYEDQIRGYGNVNNYSGSVSGRFDNMFGRFGGNGIPYQQQSMMGYGQPNNMMNQNYPYNQPNMNGGSAVYTSPYATQQQYMNGGVPGAYGQPNNMMNQNYSYAQPNMNMNGGVPNAYAQNPYVQGANANFNNQTPSALPGGSIPQQWNTQQQQQNNAATQQQTAQVTTDVNGNTVKVDPVTGQRIQ